MSESNEKDYKIAVEEKTDENEWINVPCFVGIVAQVKARDIGKLKSILDRFPGCRLIHVQTSAAYLYISDEKPPGYVRKGGF